MMHLNCPGVMVVDFEDFAEAVYDVVDTIPVGRVMTYGDIAEFLGQGGPRRVARAMALCQGAVSWHRVIRSTGIPAQQVRARQLELLTAEGTPLLDGSRVDLRQARWPLP
ncbi:MAG: MGMT family protein [Actinomycetota bacterium]|nr:MGMT family protein [Actinomycetota bacterium]